MAAPMWARGRALRLAWPHRRSWSARAAVPSQRRWRPLPDQAPRAGFPRSRRLARPSAAPPAGLRSGPGWQPRRHRRSAPPRSASRPTDRRAALPCSASPAASAASASSSASLRGTGRACTRPAPARHSCTGAASTARARPRRPTDSAGCGWQPASSSRSFRSLLGSRGCTGAATARCHRGRGESRRARRGRRTGGDASAAPKRRCPSSRYRFARREAGR